jgi:hypothetical protein
MRDAFVILVPWDNRATTDRKRTTHVPQKTVEKMPSTSPTMTALK